MEIESIEVTPTVQNDEKVVSRWLILRINWSSSKLFRILGGIKK
jgi:hypothetical protein